MKTRSSLALAATLLCTTSLHANPYGGQDMQNMMQAMQQAQECMSRIDMSSLEGLAAEGKKVENEMRRRCADGDESGALEAGMAFSKTVQSNQELKQLRKCSEKMRGMMPPQLTSMFKQLGRQAETPKDEGVCAGF